MQERKESAILRKGKGHYIKEITQIMDTVVGQDTLSPDNEIVAAKLKHFAGLLYSPGKFGYDILASDINDILRTLQETPLPQSYRQFYDRICSGSYKLERPSMLDLVRVISIMSEIEHDKVVLERAMATTTEQLQQALLADAAAKGITYIPLAELKEARNSPEKLATQRAAFRLLHKYPYNWAEDRTCMEMVAYEHILPDGGIKDGDLLVYVGSAAPPLSAIAAIQLAKGQGKEIRVAYIDEDPESADRAIREIAKLEGLGIIERGQIIAVHSDFSRVVNYTELLGQMPVSAIITAMVPNKVAVAGALKSSGVETIVALNVEGLAKLMYYPADPDKISEVSAPLRGVVLPAHLEVSVERRDVGIVKPDPTKEFWTTPHVFSTYPWQNREDSRVTNPKIPSTRIAVTNLEVVEFPVRISRL